MFWPRIKSRRKVFSEKIQVLERFKKQFSRNYLYVFLGVARSFLKERLDLKT